MAARLLVTVTALLAVAFSGCVGSEAGPEATPSQSDIAPPPQFDETTGAIHGLVTNEEGLPLAGASVGLLETPEIATTTSTAGDFTLSNLQPGTYTVAVSALGYEPAGRKVDVIPGQLTEVAFTLMAIAVETAFPITQIQDGQLACSVRAYPGFPLTGVVASGWYSGVAVCGLTGLNTASGDKFLLNWESPKGVKEAVLEMKWTTNQALGRGLTVSFEDPNGINNGRPTYGTDTGPSPLRIDANETRVLNVTGAAGRDCFESKCNFTTRVFAEANTTEFYMPVDPPAVGPFGKPRNKVDVGVVLNQRFTQYMTTFHYGTMPAGFTALPDQ